uniref:Uncharacterized protein n=1 Tax=Anguilla anguilla TaxID=7936 RepID=A0A0E9WXR4_ANGAN
MGGTEGAVAPPFLNGTQSATSCACKSPATLFIAQWPTGSTSHQKRWLNSNNHHQYV